MNRHFRPIAPAIVMVAPAGMAGAAIPAEVQALNASALTAMEAGKWEEALQTFDRCIAAHGKDAMARFGPSFGVTWYRKGICEMQLKRPEAAAKSFEVCYRDYPNAGKGEENPFNKRALARWAEAAQATGQHAEAIRLFGKFLNERTKKDPFEPGSYYIQISLCHLATGDVVQGAENLETAVKNRKSFKTPVSGTVAALQSLVATAIAKKDEATLAVFLEENRKDLAIDPFEMASYAPSFVRMATDAMTAGMDRAALALFPLIPSSDEITGALEAKITAMGEQASIEEAGRTLTKAELQATLSALAKAKREGACPEAVQLTATGVISERQSKPREAYIAYEQLEQRFPHATTRESNLFNLVRAGAMAGEPTAAAKYGPRFLETFPNSKQVPEVRRLMLLTLFQAGNHEACLKTAGELLPKLTEGSQDHDACLHILGASFQQTGRFDEATPLLDRHVSLYPQSPFARASLYFQAANRTSLEQWDEGAPLLDAFLAKHPDPASNPYFPLALLNRAQCQAAKDEDEAALEKIARLEKEFGDSALISSALGLKGDLLLKANKAREAEACYKQSLARAEAGGNRVAAGEAISRLVTLLSNQGKGRAKDAAAYCDRFWKDYSDISPARDNITLLQPAILGRAGRGQEARDRLRTTITKAAETRQLDASLEPAIREYARLYAAEHGIDELCRHFQDFPGVAAEDKALRALLKIAVIGIAEARLGEGDEASKAKADAVMKSLFQELKSEFGPKDLPPGILVRTADFLRTKTSAPRQALPYYEEAISRGDAVVRFPALLGKASVLAEGSKEEQEAAIKDLEMVFAECPDAGAKEDALYWLVMTRMKAGDLAGAGTTAERYLAHDSGFGRYVPEVRLALGGSYQGRNMTTEALSTHERVWREQETISRVSNQAMRSWLLLSWARQAPAKDGARSDRQAAYEEGQAFLDRTRPLYGKMAAFDQETWLEIEKLVAEYGRSTDVKPIAKTPTGQGPE